MVPLFFTSPIWWSRRSRPWYEQQADWDPWDVLEKLCGDCAERNVESEQSKRRKKDKISGRVGRKEEGRKAVSQIIS